MSEEKKVIKSSDDTLCIGLDIGTGNLCCINSKDNTPRIMRNSFLKLDEDEVDSSELKDISHVKSEDGSIYIIGEDSHRLANIFGKTIQRPMKSGLISPDEIDSIEIITMMLSSLIGDVRHSNALCSYSVPAEAIDEKKSVVYHEKVFGKILSGLGINHSPINESMAVLYSECAKDKFSGVALSFGAGLCNVAIGFRGVKALSFSTGRSGDFIDSSVADSLNMIQNRVTSIKEKSFSFKSDFSDIKNKKTRRCLEAVRFYYDSLIEYTIKQIVKKFESDSEIEIEDAIPIVIAGGTSLPEGFIEAFSECIRKYDLGFEISEIRAAESPLTSVSNGLLIRTMSDVEK